MGSPPRNHGCYIVFFLSLLSFPRNRLSRSFTFNHNNYILRSRVEVPPTPFATVGSSTSCSRHITSCFQPIHPSIYSHVPPSPAIQPHNTTGRLDPSPNFQPSPPQHTPQNALSANTSSNLRMRYPPPRHKIKVRRLRRRCSKPSCIAAPSPWGKMSLMLKGVGC